MRELLEKLAKVMPEGYELWLYGRAWNFGVVGYGKFDIRPTLGDIGLAPLTALLKQEIRKTHSMSMGWTGGGCELMLWRSLQESDYHVGWEPGESTDFEAVAHAYLAIKEAQ